MALSILTVVGIVLLKLSLNILSPRQWTLRQSVADAYMSFERSYAQRIPFEELVPDDSAWPTFPATSTVPVEVGRLPAAAGFPDGVPITGTIIRTKVPDIDNYPMDGGSGTVASNPAAMKIWKAQSILTYTIGGRTYVKSRTVLRSQ